MASGGVLRAANLTSRQRINRALAELDVLLREIEAEEDRYEAAERARASTRPVLRLVRGGEDG